MHEHLAVFGVILGVAIGVPVGLAVYTFIYAEGVSYFSDDPTACANCHVMQGHYDDWTRSSHRAVAACNDCHTPAGLAAKYMTKARNGYHHSLAFTTGRFHEPIQITESNRRITEDACRCCHQDIVRAIDTAPREEDSVSCIRCHASVGHQH